VWLILELEQLPVFVAVSVLGNPRGAVTVVEFFDYRCPYCRIMEPRLHELLTQDKSVRLVLKDWPIFGGVSVYAAQVAIAAGWQGKYAPVHDACSPCRGPWTAML
jgi:protein-disulfide isomerase